MNHCRHRLQSPRLVEAIIKSPPKKKQALSSTLSFIRTSILSQVWCWGQNDDGQLGDGTTTNCTIPTQTSLTAAASQIDLGLSHSCAVDDRSDLYCWGWNRYGEFGLGTFNSYKHIPTKVTAVDGVFQVNAGGHFTFLDDGNDNNTTSRNTPTQLNRI